MDGNPTEGPWQRLNQGKTVVDLVNTLFTMFGVVYGVWKTTWEFSIRRSTSHLGSICRDANQMGYFYPDIPSKWRKLFPFTISRTETPRVPTVSSLIKAGDDFSFTSSMFYSIPKRHAQVSWKPLYEAFFRELEFSALFQPSTHVHLGGELERYSSKARLDVRKRVGLMREDRKWFDRKWCSNTAQFLRNLLCWVTGYKVERQSNKNVGQFDQRCYSLDRHLLYEPSPAAGSARLPTCRSGKDEENYGEERGGQPRPVLVKCIRDLKTLIETHHQTPKAHKRNLPETAEPWWQGPQTLWISNGRPCIEVSEEEMAALSFILGINLRCSLPEGVGSFGTALTSESIGCLPNFRLTSVPPPEFKIPKGSGYTTLFAKHIACGCLPFAQRRVGKIETQTIAVGEELLKGLKSGQPIVDKEAEFFKATYYLDSLPASSENNFYSVTQPNGSIGDIISCKGATVGSWWEAVAGMAFGGLVPFAGEELIRAVRFSVADAFPRKGIAALLAELIHTMDEKSPEYVSELQLFGDYSPSDVSRYESKEAIVTFEQDHNDSRTRLAVRRLTRYSTLLERIVACVGHTSRTPQDDVFTACSKEIQQSYCQAVGASSFGRKDVSSITDHVEEKPSPGNTQNHVAANSYTNTTQDVIPNDARDVDIGLRGFEKELRDIITKTRKGSLASLTYVDCAKVARCVIFEWTHTVRPVRWNSETGELKSTEFSTVESYKPAPLPKLPGVSLWE